MILCNYKQRCGIARSTFNNLYHGRISRHGINPAWVYHLSYRSPVLVGLQNRPWDWWQAAATATMVRVLRVRRTSKRSSFFLRALLSRGRARYNTIYNTCAVRILYTLYIVYVYSTRIYIYAYMPMRGTRAPYRTRVAVAANDARPVAGPVRGSAALPASSLEVPCAGPFAEGAYTHALYIMISTRVYVNQRCVRVLPPPPPLLLPRSSRREATEGRAILEWLQAVRRGRARRERGHDLLGGRTRRTCAARKQTAGWIFVFTFHVVIAMYRVVIHKYTI